METSPGDKNKEHHHLISSQAFNKHLAHADTHESEQPGATGWEIHWRLRVQASRHKTHGKSGRIPGHP